MKEIPTNPTTQQTWREPYKAALAEVNQTEVRRKIDLACAAILQRIDELAGAGNASAIDEQLEILDSLRRLRTIQRLESRASANANQPAKHTSQEGAP